MGTFLVILLVLVVLIFGFIITIYNRLIRLIEAINNDKRQIDIQLDRRFKVFESLINVVKKYMDYEKSTLVDVIALRTKAQDAAAKGDDKARFAAEDAISKIASGINVVFEQYPDLKANENALQLQEEVVNTENKLAFAKQAYNNSIEKYNAEKKSFFQSMIVSWFKGKLDKKFEYWKLADDTITEKEAYTVKL